MCWLLNLGDGNRIAEFIFFVNRLSTFLLCENHANGYCFFPFIWGIHIKKTTLPISLMLDWWWAKCTSIMMLHVQLCIWIIEARISSLIIPPYPLIININADASLSTWNAPLVFLCHSFAVYQRTCVLLMQWLMRSLY